MNFFSRKTAKFLCTYQPLLFCKILKEFLELIQSYQDAPFSGTKWPICPEQNFLIQTSIITFIYLLALFIVQNLQKLFTVDPKLWTQNGPFAPNFFFGKFLISLLSNYQPLSLCKISKKSFQSYVDVQFLGIKLPICPKEIFSRKAVNEPCSFHSCLSTSQKSK